MSRILNRLPNSVSDKVPQRFRFYNLAWIHAKLAFMVWGFLLIFYPSQETVDALGRFLSIIVGLFIVVGSLVSIVGILFTTANHPPLIGKGYVVELTGLILLIQGPLVLFLMRVWYVIDDASGRNVSAAIVSYVTLAFIFGRFASLNYYTKRPEELTP